MTVFTLPAGAAARASDALRAPAFVHHEHVREAMNAQSLAKIGLLLAAGR